MRLLQVRIFAAFAMSLLAAWPVWAATPCARCHPAEVAGFKAGAMRHSLGPVRGPSGSFFDKAANAEFTIRSGPAGMIQHIEQDGVSSEYPTAYSIGSGAHAVGYPISLSNHLFQSPLAYYPGADGAWRRVMRIRIKWISTVP